MTKKAKIGGRGKFIHVKNPCKYKVRPLPNGQGFGCYCITTGRLISSGIIEYKARKRAGKLGWTEDVEGPEFRSLV